MFSTKFDRAARQQADAAIIRPKQITRSEKEKKDIKVNRVIYFA
jgi:hypothetical protein